MIGFCYSSVFVLHTVGVMYRDDHMDEHRQLCAVEVLHPVHPAVRRSSEFTLLDGHPGPGLVLAQSAQSVRGPQNTLLLIHSRLWVRTLRIFSFNFLI